MSKESEALSRLYYTVRVLQSEINQKEQLLGSNTTFDVLEQTDKDVKILKEALHRLEAIDNSNPSEASECLEAIEQDIKDRVILAEDRQLKLCAVIKQALLKSQENARSEEILQKYYQEGITLDSVRALREENAELRQKTQEPKHYLKWEDLDFKEKRQEIPVRMGETTYTLVLRKTDGGNKIAKLLSPKRNYIGEWGDIFYEEAKQFFNDLRLERVE